jgi:hypothetical protein
MNKHTRRHSRFLFVLSILPPTAWVAYAQSTTSLRGTVNDSLGGVIPAAVATLSDPGKRGIAPDRHRCRRRICFPSGTTVYVDAQELRSRDSPHQRATVSSFDQVVEVGDGAALRIDHVRIAGGFRSSLFSSVIREDEPV